MPEEIRAVKEPAARVVRLDEPDGFLKLFDGFVEKAHLLVSDRRVIVSVVIRIIGGIDLIDTQLVAKIIDAESLGGLDVPVRRLRRSR
jgi:hypothetical protein